MMEIKHSSGRLCRQSAKRYRVDFEALFVSTPSFRELDINSKAPPELIKVTQHPPNKTFFPTTKSQPLEKLIEWHNFVNRRFRCPTFNARFVDKNLSFCRNHLIIFVCSQSSSLPSSFIQVNAITNLSLKERADNGNCIDRSIQFGA